MKLCFIADATSIHIKEWLHFFVKKEHSVFLITDTENTINGVKMFNIGDCLPALHIPLLSAGWQILTKTRKIKRILKQIQPDILHAHYATNYGFLAAQANHHPFLLTCHGSDLLLDPNQNAIQQYFVKTALRKADFITIPSQEMQDKILHYGIDSSKTAIIQYGIECQKFTFKINHTKPVKILSSRQLTQKYRVDILVKALAKIDHPFFATIIGDGAERSNLEQLAARNNLTQKVNFTGRVSNTDIANYLQAAHLYVTTSPTDGLSISLLEAFAAGCYPIVPDNNSNRYVKSLGFKMALFPVNDVSQLNKKIDTILANPKIVVPALKDNHCLVKKLFSRETNLNRFNKLYETLR